MRDAMVARLAIGNLNEKATSGLVRKRTDIVECCRSAIQYAKTGDQLSDIIGVKKVGPLYAFVLEVFSILTKSPKSLPNSESVEAVAPSCESCFFWKPSPPGINERVGGDIGTCRRYPPQISDARTIDEPHESDSRLFASFSPATWADDWCGEHKPT
jgi:hypothetical protein